MNTHNLHLAQGDRAAVSERELLEGAATAAEIGWRWFGATFCVDDNVEMGTFKPWNPITNDGDALRLAVKLGMSLDIWPDHACHVQAGGATACVDESLRDGDPYAATRRAIVRAAASLHSVPPQEAGPSGKEVLFAADQGEMKGGQE